MLLHRRFWDPVLRDPEAFHITTVAVVATVDPTSAQAASSVVIAALACWRRRHGPRGSRLAWGSFADTRH